MLTCRELDTNNPEDIKAFEQAQYTAFAQSPLSSLQEIWEFNHRTHRVKSTIPYNHLLITVVENPSGLIGAMVIHTNMAGSLQLNHFGFSIDATQQGCAEGLSIFSLFPIVKGEIPLFHLRDFTNPLLRKKGFTLLYGTCSKPRLKAYLLLGFRQVAAIDYKNEEKFLLSIQIPQ